MHNYIKIILINFLFFILTPSVFSKIDIDARTVILQDYLSGEILYEKEPDLRIYPASMTKIMTTLVAFDMLKKGETTLDEEIIISEKAWRMSQSGYSSMFIMLNDKVTVEELLKGIIIVSGNDACVALAEGLAGSEESFAILMNEKAAEIGMTDSNFSNSSGINDPDNYSTVKDIAIMSKYLIKNYPEYYEWFKETTFTWEKTGGNPITQGNRNPLLYKNLGVDGIKTGYLAVEQYSLASSLIKKERRLIAVGSGFKSKNKRSSESAKILTWGLSNFDTIRIAKKDENFSTIDVWLGKKEKLNVKINQDAYITIPKRKKSLVKAVIEYDGPIKAPILKDTKVGKLNIYYRGNLKNSLDIYASEDIKLVNFIYRFIKSINYLIWGDV
ncbi:MAG: D-alanyl-D-alanine carboxypeptidase [Candidatus Pelagibacter sp. TMED64]|nr:D-alanyl-D-alanine carboxypeptidase [Candidatus Pelagibacter sp.]OUU66839.1 MAG: D-alanyl-D-alanine carboxypeptidase [Candidatus Pelagibacter sp. TMED64]